MYNFKIGTLDLIIAGVPQNGILLQTPINGLDDPDRRINVYSNTGQDGSTISGAFYDKRLVRLVGQITSPNPVAHEAARRLLSTACRIQRDDYGQPILTRVSFTTMGGNDYFFDAILDQPKYPWDIINLTDFLVTMTAGDPFLYTPSEVISPWIGIATGGGFISPFISPFTLGTASGGVITVTNNGNVEANPVIEIMGPMTWPYLYNQTTGDFMRITTTINAGDTAKIDMKKRTITLNDSSSLMAFKTTDSDFWKLAMGLNTITVNTISTSDTGAARVRFFTPYLGS